MTRLFPNFRFASVIPLSLLLILTSLLVAQLELKGAPASKAAAVFPLPDWGTSAAFSRDGRQVAVGTYGKVLIIDVESKKVAREIPVKSGYVRGVAWLADHSTVVTGCFQAVEFWNAADGKNIRSLKIKGYANDVQASPDGKLIAAATETGEVRMWHAVDGSERSVWSAGKDPLLGLAFSADGALIAAAGGDETRLSRPGVVKVWKVSDGSEAKALDVVPEKCGTDVAFSPDATALYVADMNDRVTVFDLATGVARGFFGKHGRPVNSVVPMKDGARVVSGGGGRFQDGNLVMVWTASDGKELATLDHHKGKVAAVALSPDESLLMTVSFDKTAALWNVNDLLTPAPQSPSLLEPRSEAARARNPWKVSLGPQFAADQKQPEAPVIKRVGIIGLDTSHSTAFTREFNAPKKDGADAEGAAANPLEGFRITAAYPKGSEDIESSVSRVPEYTKQVVEHGVKISSSIDEMLKEVDYVLLETNDGRPHLDQVLPVLKAGKPVFVDKPVAGSLSDAIAIYEAARKYNTPLFSSSSLRFKPGCVAVREGNFGEVLGADASSPCSLEKTHPDLYWYGIHGVEILFTAMGTGCQSVSRTSTENFDVAVGLWDSGRVGTFRGIREAKAIYGLTTFSKKSSQVIELELPGGKRPAPVVAKKGDAKATPPAPRPQSSYYPLLVEIVKFFETGKPPVSEAETLEIYAFMSAADESKRQGGVPVTLESVMAPARAEAAEILKKKLN